VVAPEHHTTLRAYVRCHPAEVARDATLAEVARAMEECGTGAVVVIDEAEHPVGIVTERDIVIRATANRYPADARVDSVMTEPVITIHEGTDPVSAVLAFRDHDVRHLPVVDDSGTVVDVLSADDLLVGLAGDLVELADAMVAIPASDAES
jgi:CBS domain-containing protein